MTDWVIRRAVADDESVIASMWLHSLCRGQDARAAGMKDAADRGSDAHIAWWEMHQPIVTGLLRQADVVVACDPERVDYAPGKPAIVWGWMVSGVDVVFGLGIKRIVSNAGFGVDLARDLLGTRLERRQRTVMDLVDLQALRLIPATWVRERGWVSSLRHLSERVLEGDATYQGVANHVLDPKRVRWQPNSRRAA